MYGAHGAGGIGEGDEVVRCDQVAPGVFQLHGESKGLADRLGGERLGRDGEVLVRAGQHCKRIAATAQCAVGGRECDGGCGTGQEHRATPLPRHEGAGCGWRQCPGGLGTANGLLVTLGSAGIVAVSWSAAAGALTAMWATATPLLKLA